MDTESNIYAEARVTWWHRAKWRIWRQPPWPLITNDPRTFITVHIGTDLSWRDRVGVLIFGRLKTQALVYTDVEVAQAETRAISWVE